MPTPFQSMLLGSGIPQEIPMMETGFRGRRILTWKWINSEGVSAWREGYQDVWRENGVWSLNSDGKPHLLRPRHFSELNGRQVNFASDYYRPFIERFASEVRSIHPQAILFIEEPLNSEIPLLNLPNAANGSHWYDVFVLIKRRYLNYFALNPQSKRPIFGAKAIRKSFAKQLEHIKTIGRERVKGPTLIGECGIAYDLNDKIGFTEGRFSEHRKAMNRTYIAIEDNLLSCTLWNYTSDNNNLHGDQWNGEDFSLFSRDQIHSLDSPEDLNAGGAAP